VHPGDVRAEAEGVRDGAGLAASLVPSTNELIIVGVGSMPSTGGSVQL
jgi:hypothetical protein